MMNVRRLRLPILLGWLLLGVAVVLVGQWWTGSRGEVAGLAEPAVPAGVKTKVERDGSAAGRSDGGGKDAKLHKWADLAQRGELMLTGAEVEAYLEENRRNAESLLAAYLLTGKGKQYLEEALERFPDDPRVLHLAAEAEYDPEKKLALLERYIANAPDNALGGYLAAGTLLKLGRTEEALEMFDAAAGKKWTDYTKELIQAKEDALASAGFDDVGPRLMSAYGHSAASLMQMRATMEEMVKVMAQRTADGDVEGAEHLREAMRGMAGQIRDGNPTVVHQLVANAIESRTYKDLGTPEAEAEMAAIKERGKALSESAVAVGKLIEKNGVTERDLGTYLTRVKVLGEAEANEWLLERYPAEP